MSKRKLKPFNSVIQICPDCSKVDVYLNDGHDCGQWLANQAARDHFWDAS